MTAIDVEPVDHDSVTVAERDVPPLFAATEYDSAPLPVPDAVDTVTQLALDEAVHPQSPCVRVIEALYESAASGRAVRLA